MLNRHLNTVSGHKIVALCNYCTMYIDDVNIVTTLWIEDTIFSGWEGGGEGRLGAKVESSRH